MVLALFDYAISMPTVFWQFSEGCLLSRCHFLSKIVIILTFSTTNRFNYIRITR